MPTNPDEPTLTPASVPVPPDRRHELLAQFGLLSEDDLALLWGVEPKTLRNKPYSELPEFVTVGRQRLYYAESVAMLMRAKVRKAGRSR
jgi:hypothetical protein